MALRGSLRIALAVLLCLGISAPGFGQSNTTPTTPVNTPSTGKALAIVAVSGAIFAVALYSFLHRRKTSSTPSGSSFVGCTSVTDHGLVLTDEKDGQDYVILGGPTLNAGERVQVSARKDEDDAGRLALDVGKLVKDYGPCKPAAAPNAPVQP